MRRVRYYEHGGPDVLRVEEADTPTPGPGQVLIRAEAIGLNYIDSAFRRGTGAFRRPLPGILTGDVVGTVEAIGPDVATVRKGDRVAALVEDAYADQVVADADWTVGVPEGLADGPATALPMAGPVALGALRAARLAPGETVLVNAAAGGIGHLALQLAKLEGAGTVIGTAGSPAKLGFAREHGADVAIDYTDPGWPDLVRAAAPNGVDVILDAVGGTVQRQSLDLLAPLGRAVLYGGASGELPDIGVRTLFALKTVTGFAITAWRLARPEQARREMTELADHIAAGRLRVAVHATLTLTDAAQAHRLLDERAQLGRLLLTP